MDVLLEICRHLLVNMSCLPGEYDTSSVVTSSYPYLKDVPHLEYSYKIVIFLWRQTSECVFCTRQLSEHLELAFVKQIIRVYRTCTEQIIDCASF